MNPPHITTHTHLDPASPTLPRTEHDKRHTKTETVVVVGLGYVGLPLAIAAEEAGFRVRGFDIDPVKIEFLKRREAAYLSPEELEAFSDSEMDIDDTERVLVGADIVVIAVPTPVNEDHTPDLGPLQSACFIVGQNLKPGALVVVESTVNPGACETVAIPILETTSKEKAGSGFSFAHCPERVNPGDPTYSVRNIPRVIGGSDERSVSRALSFYRSFVSADIVPMKTIKEAEAVKMVENAFRDVNIAFVNELAMSFERAGIDIVNVIRGASSKPFSFMPHFPGCGVGGHCIPVDPYYLIHYGEANGFKHHFLKAARKVNNSMPRHTVLRLREAMETAGIPLPGTPVALLGLTYKRDIPDIRESPAIMIRDELVKQGAVVRTFDPYARRESSAESLEEALSGARAVILATDHREFREALTPKLLVAEGVGFFVDGRNAFPKDEFESAGIVYRGIGR